VAGIGCGSTSSVTAMTISGGSLYINAGSVGTNYVNTGPNMIIRSPHIDCRAIGTTVCLQAPSVVFDNGSLTAVTGASNLINANTVSFSGSPSIYVIYTGSSTQETFTGLPIIHIESITFSCNSSYEVTATGDYFDRTVLFNPRSARGFGISVPSVGNYSLEYKARYYSSEGKLTHDGFDDFSVATNSDSFYTTVVGDEVTDCKPLPTMQFTKSASSLFTKSASSLLHPIVRPTATELFAERMRVSLHAPIFQYAPFLF
jgi:hypothetical protein